MHAKPGQKSLEEDPIDIKKHLYSDTFCPLLPRHSLQALPCPQKDNASLLDKAVAWLHPFFFKEGGHGRIVEYHGHFKQFLAISPGAGTWDCCCPFPPKAHASLVVGI